MKNYLITLILLLYPVMSASGDFVLDASIGTVNPDLSTTLTISATSDTTVPLSAFNTVVQVDNFVGFSGIDITQTVLLGAPALVENFTNASEGTTAAASAITFAAPFPEFPAGIPVPILEILLEPVAPLTQPASYDLTVLPEEPGTVRITSINSATFAATTIDFGSSINPTNGTTNVAIPEPNAFLLIAGLVAVGCVRQSAQRLNLAIGEASDQV